MTESMIERWAPGMLFMVAPEMAEDGWISEGNVYEVTSVDDSGLRLGFTGDDGEPECGIGVQYVTRVEATDV